MHKHREYIPEIVDRPDVIYYIDFDDDAGERHNILAGSLCVEDVLCSTVVSIAGNKTGDIRSVHKYIYMPSLLTNRK